MNKNLTATVVSCFMYGNLVLVGIEGWLLYYGFIIWQLALMMLVHHFVPALFLTPMLVRAVRAMQDPAPVVAEPAPEPVVENPVAVEPLAPAPVVVEPEPAPAPPPSPFQAVIEQAETERLRIAAEKQANFDAAVEAARPAAERWVFVIFPGMLHNAVLRRHTYVCLNPTSSHCWDGVRDSVRVLLGLDEKAFGNQYQEYDRYLRLTYFLSPRGCALIESLFAAGFTLTVGSVPFTTVDGLRRIVYDPSKFLGLGNTTSHLFVEWPHLTPKTP